MSRIVSPSGQRPIEVALDDGSRSWFFCQDVTSYKVAVESGRYPLGRAFPGFPPPELGYQFASSPRSRHADNVRPFDVRPSAASSAA